LTPAEKIDVGRTVGTLGLKKNRGFESGRLVVLNRGPPKFKGTAPKHKCNKLPCSDGGRSRAVVEPRAAQRCSPHPAQRRRRGAADPGSRSACARAAWRASMRHHPGQTGLTRGARRLGSASLRECSQPTTPATDRDAHARTRPGFGTLTPRASHRL
jgi:hypothetical protein